MLMDPEKSIELIKEMKYAELVHLRDEVIKYIQVFESKPYVPRKTTMFPTPDVAYQVRLQFLAKLCVLICEKFNEEFEQ